MGGGGGRNKTFQRTELLLEKELPLCISSLVALRKPLSSAGLGLVFCGWSGGEGTAVPGRQGDFGCAGGGLPVSSAEGVAGWPLWPAVGVSFALLRIYLAFLSPP